MIVCAKSNLFQVEPLRAVINLKLTGFQHCSWHKKSYRFSRVAVVQSGRLRERELVKKPKRARVLASKSIFIFLADVKFLRS